MNDDLILNHRFGDFIPLERIGQRSALTLYRATQESLKRFVHFKVVSLDEISEQPGQLADELRVHISSVLPLEHMHLQPIYSYGVVDDRHLYVAGRFMSGSLNGLLRAGALPPPRALELGLQIALATAYIHTQGFIHSSISPHNVYLDDTGDAFIDDLELSLIVQRASSIEHLKLLLDEPFYASPEQLQLAPLDFRSEVYSVGAILYRMLTGSPPFSDGNPGFEAALKRKLRNQLIPPRTLIPSLSPTLDEAVVRMLRADPAERFPDMASAQAVIWTTSEIVREAQISVLKRLQLVLSRFRPRG
jgi:serine/threonine-protein kinase